MADNVASSIFGGSDFLDKLLGLTLLSVVLFYMFKDTAGTKSLLQGFGDLYTGGLKALQGR